MPSIEIAVIGLPVPRAPPPTSFPVAYEAGLRSHRLPSRFQSDFDRLSGSLYHLGRPEPSVEGDSTFSSELLSLESRSSDPPCFIQFAQAHVSSVDALLGWLLANSPSGNLLFTSDWQFGPGATTLRSGPLSLAEFWTLHDSRRLQVNAAYPLCAAAGQSGASPA